MESVVATQALRLFKAASRSLKKAEDPEKDDAEVRLEDLARARRLNSPAQWRRTTDGDNQLIGGV